MWEIQKVKVEILINSWTAGGILESVGSPSWEISGSADLRKTVKLAEAKNERAPPGKQNFLLFN